MRKVLPVLVGILLVTVVAFPGCKGNVTETVISTYTVISSQTITQTSTMTSTPPAVTLPVTTETVTTTLPVETVTVTGSRTTITSTSTKTATTTITASPSIITNIVDGIVVFEYSGKGNSATLPFSIYESPWAFEYMTDWSGDFTAYLSYNNGADYAGIVIAPVTAWETYSTYVYNKFGDNMYIYIDDIPADGLWTIRVIQLT